MDKIIKRGGNASSRSRLFDYEEEMTYFRENFASICNQLSGFPLPCTLNPLYEDYDFVKKVLKSKKSMA